MELSNFLNQVIYDSINDYVRNNSGLRTRFYHWSTYSIDKEENRYMEKDLTKEDHEAIMEEVIYRILQIDRVHKMLETKGSNFLADLLDSNDWEV